MSHLVRFKANDGIVHCKAQIGKKYVAHSTHFSGGIFFSGDGRKD